MKNPLPENLTKLTAADITAIESSVSDINTKIDPTVTEIAPIEKRNYPQGGPKKDATILLAQEVAHNFPGIFSQNYDPTRIETFIKKRDDSAHLSGLLMVLVNKLNATQSVNDIHASDEANYIYNTVKLAEQHDASLKTYADNLGKFFQKGARVGFATFPVPASGFVDINNVVPGTKVINNGTTIVKFKAGAQLAAKIKKMDQPVTINPSGSATVPPGYTSICIENQSTTDEGSFEVKLKAAKK